MDAQKYMNNKSRKAKGRLLQNLVRDKIIKLFPALTCDDIRTSMISEDLEHFFKMLSKVH